MSAIASVYATFATPEDAERIGLIVVEERLAACVNILGGCRSIYRWHGAIETADEVAAIFKTSAARAGPLADRIAALHDYAVPAIAIWPILGAYPAYEAWVIDQVT